MTRESKREESPEAKVLLLKYWTAKTGSPSMAGKIDTCHLVKYNR